MSVVGIHHVTLLVQDGAKATLFPSLLWHVSPFLKGLRHGGDRDNEDCPA